MKVLFDADIVRQVVGAQVFLHVPVPPHSLLWVVVHEVEDRRLGLCRATWLQLELRKNGPKQRGMIEQRDHLDLVRRRHVLDPQALLPLRVFRLPLDELAARAANLGPRELADEQTACRRQQKCRPAWALSVLHHDARTWTSQARPAGIVPSRSSWGDACRRAVGRHFLRPAARLLRDRRVGVDLCPLKFRGVLGMVANPAGAVLGPAEDQPPALLPGHLQRLRVGDGVDPRMLWSTQRRRAGVFLPKTPSTRARAFLAVHGTGPRDHRTDPGRGWGGEHAAPQSGGATPTGHRRDALLGGRTPSLRQRLRKMLNLSAQFHSCRWSSDTLVGVGQTRHRRFHRIRLLSVKKPLIPFRYQRANP